VLLVLSSGIGVIGVCDVFGSWVPDDSDRVPGDPLGAFSNGEDLSGRTPGDGVCDKRNDDGAHAAKVVGGDRTCCNCDVPSKPTGEEQLRTREL
jgi:hypothetical protein